MTKIIMGRRVRTNNCSPVDSVMDKYHSDIGHRLSGVFIPTQSKTDSNDVTDFCMLTLDTRHMNNTKNNQDTVNCAKRVLDFSSSVHQTESYEHKPETLSCESSTSSSNMASSCTHNEDIHKDKKGIVDKLARAIFQRKHTCSRCQRRSRSCLPNKNFNGTEKHYMCGNCRENSYAIKNLFSNLSSDHKDNTSNSSSSTYREERSTVIQPRSQFKDSGYDTVTSCSTLASAYSAFNTPESKEKFPKSQTNTQYIQHNANATYIQDSENATYIQHSENDTYIQHSENNTYIQHSENDTYIQHSENAPYTQHYESNDYIHLEDCFTPAAQNQQSHVASPQNCYSTVPEVHHLVMVGHCDLPGGVLRQVRTRHIQDYDGYLPTQCTHHNPIEARQPLSDTTNSNFCHNDTQNSTKKTTKCCHVCATTTKPCFRLPWQDGWLCEDCLDGMM